ncbi:MAG: Rpn family recombination-promoting nuclease/putative transposase [Bacteroidota bacterium]
MITKFLDPKNDFAFKRVFGTEKNKDILMHFLNDILDHQYIGEIREVTFLPTVQVPEVAASKQSIVDVLCQDQRGVQYIIEMQVTATAGFEKRAQYYAAKAYSGQLFEGDDYDELREVIFLAITNFTMFPSKSSIKSDHIILDRATYEHDLQEFSFTFIELPKFDKQLDELLTISEKWYYYLKHAPATTPEVYSQLVKGAPALKRAYDELERFSWSAEELVKYEQIKKRDKDNASALLRQFQQGEEQGIAKGRAEGKAEAKQSMVRQMLSRGLNISFVSELTGLSEAGIRSL